MRLARRYPFDHVLLAAEINGLADIFGLNRRADQHTSIADILLAHDHFFLMQRDVHLAVGFHAAGGGDYLSCLLRARGALTWRTICGCLLRVSGTLLSTGGQAQVNASRPNLRTPD